MTVDGAWEGDPESKPCEMGGGPVVNYDDDPAFKAQTLRGDPSFRLEDPLNRTCLWAVINSPYYDAVHKQLATALLAVITKHNIKRSK